MNNVVNNVPYLRTSRDFPEDIRKLVLEMGKSYIDIAGAVNNRTISIFPTNNPAVTGESFYLTTGQRQQTLRQVYTFTSTADIQLNFKLNTISAISRAYGSYTDSNGNWYGLIFATGTAIAGQISFFLFANAGTTPDVIGFRSGAGAPTVLSGLLVLEWISNP